jgi:uncharacterized damage-inducible protein DinB
MKLAAVLVVSVSFAGLACAQDSHPLVDAMIKHYQASKELTLAVADAMPADQYSFKATDPEMSFGEQMNHIAAANANYCAAGLETKSPFGELKDASKPAAEKNLNTAFDFCLDGLKKLTDAGLTKVTGTGARQATVFERFWGGFTHTAHHRGQAEVYLRLKGITPPQYKF